MIFVHCNLCEGVIMVRNIENSVSRLGEHQRGAHGKRQRKSGI